jgi:glycosyltransferase involved in cell wall biosynthesis
VVASCLAAARLVVTPSAAMLAALVTHYGVPGSARVIHNARSAEGFRTATKRPLVLGVGRVWDEVNNMGALDRAARRCPWAVAIAGETRTPGGPRHGSWRAKTLGVLEPDVLATWYAQAAIFAHPARYEPFGFPPLEAALSGCALVLGDIPSLREVWGDAAFYVPPDDEDALVYALTRLVRDRALRETMAARALVRASRYTPERLAADYLDAYRALPLLAPQAPAPVPAPSR